MAKQSSERRMDAPLKKESLCDSRDQGGSPPHGEQGRRDERHGEKDERHEEKEVRPAVWQAGDQKGWGWSTDCHGNAVWEGLGCSWSHWCYMVPQLERWAHWLDCIGQGCAKLGAAQTLCLKEYNSPLVFDCGMGPSPGHKAVLMHSLGIMWTLRSRHSNGAGFAAFRIQLLFSIHCSPPMLANRAISIVASLPGKLATYRSFWSMCCFWPCPRWGSSAKRAKWW